MVKSTPLSFVDLIALEPLGKDTETYISKRPAFDSLGMLEYAVYFVHILTFLGEVLPLFLPAESLEPFRK